MCQKPSAEFCRPCARRRVSERNRRKAAALSAEIRRQNQLKSQNSGDTPQGGFSCPCGAIHLLCLGILTAQPASVCAVREPIQSMLWMGEETQGSKAPLLPMGRSEAVRTLRRRASQRAASPRKNACIFEKRVEVSRHAEGAHPSGAPPCVMPGQWSEG